MFNAVWKKALQNIFFLITINAESDVNPVNPGFISSWFIHQAAEDVHVELSTQTKPESENKKQFLLAEQENCKCWIAFALYCKKKKKKKESNACYISNLWPSVFLFARVKMRTKQIREGWFRLTYVSTTLLLC